MPTAEGPPALACGARGGATASRGSQWNGQQTSSIDCINRSTNTTYRVSCEALHEGQANWLRAVGPHAPQSIQEETGRRVASLLHRGRQATAVRRPPPPDLTTNSPHYCSLHCLSPCDWMRLAHHHPREPGRLSPHDHVPWLRRLPDRQSARSMAPHHRALRPANYRLLTVAHVGQACSLLWHKHAVAAARLVSRPWRLGTSDGDVHGLERLRRRKKSRCALHAAELFSER